MQSAVASDTVIHAKTSIRLAHRDLLQCARRRVDAYETKAVERLCQTADSLHEQHYVCYNLCESPQRKRNLHWAQ